MIDLLYKRDGQTRFYFVNQIRSKLSIFASHDITDTKDRNSLVEVIYEKSFFKKFPKSSRKHSNVK